MPMKLTSALGTQSAKANSAPTRLTPEALAAYCNISAREEMIEIQTFFLADRIVDHGDKQNFDASVAAIHTVNVRDENTPFQFSPHYMLVLRRQTADSSETAVVRFRLTDSDGRSITALKPETFDRTFPKENKFAVTTGHFEFMIPGGGDYFLEISLTNVPMSSPFTYHFQVWRKPEHEGAQNKSIEATPDGAPHG